MVPGLPDAMAMVPATAKPTTCTPAAARARSKHVTPQRASQRSATAWKVASRTLAMMSCISVPPSPVSVTHTVGRGNRRVQRQDGRRR